MSFDPYYDRPRKPKGHFPLWLFPLLAVAFIALGLWVWYLVAPVSLARAYGRAIGPSLAVDSLDVAVDGQIRRISSGSSLTVNPKRRLSVKSLHTNRWLNYDLLFYSPDFDVNVLVKDGASLIDLFGQDAFMEPKTATIEIREGEKTVASFALKGAFTAGDFEEMASSAVEPSRKIGYYRKALELDPKAAAAALGLRDSLKDAGQIDELIALLEEDLAAALDDKAREDLLNRLLALYKDKKDQKLEISTLSRLLSLAEKTGQASKARNFLVALARANKENDPFAAAGFYEKLAESEDERLARASLLELLSLYRALKNEAKEEEALLRLLPLAENAEAPLLWGEIIRLREKKGDRKGQAEAWEKLAGILPPGESRANAYKRLGFLRYESEDLAGSESAYLLAIKDDDQDPAVYLNLARLARSKDDRAAYRNNLAKALSLSDRPEVRLELAQALTQDGIKADAVRHFEALAALSDGTAEGAKTRDFAKGQLVSLHRPPEGESSEDFERVLYSHSQDSVEFYNLGVAGFQKKDWDKAKKAFLRSLELKPDAQLEADARGYLLALFEATGQTKEMLEQANWIYPADPAKKEVRDLLARQYQKDKDWAGLAKAATEWTGQADEAENWRYLAEAQERLGQKKNAAQSLLKAAQRDSKAAAWLLAAVALEKTGDRGEAKRAYQRALDLDPNNSDAENALLRLAVEGLNKGRANKK